MESYAEVTEFLFKRIPQFQRVGADAYKPGLENMREIARRVGNPERGLKCVHVAGTNGKGSVSNLIAATLQKAGYTTGLYTSPHLVDFRERMRIDGKMISEQEVVDFVNKNRQMIEECNPSFFELSTVMAFDYFARNSVDTAVIEVGLGGRLDSTNIINPDLCVITNISKDHTQFLGNTLKEIAGEKAGIIKPGVPVVIGESDPEYDSVFVNKAKSEGASLSFAHYDGKLPECQLTGLYQSRNIVTALSAITRLREECGYEISEDAIKEGFGNVCDITGFCGRWMTLGSEPTVICDAGHNYAGIEYVAQQLEKEKKNVLHMVVGFVKDKDIDNILKLLPKKGRYYFAKASIPRALDASELRTKAMSNGLHGNAYATVEEAYKTALGKAGKEDLVFVGGSCFVVADLLKSLQVAEQGI